MTCLGFLSYYSCNILTLPSYPLPSKVPGINTIGCRYLSGQCATSHPICRNDLFRAFNISHTKRIQYKMTYHFRLPIASNHDTIVQTFSFHYQYSQLGIPFSEQMSCTQSRKSGANNNNVPNFCSHSQALVTTFFVPT